MGHFLYGNITDTGSGSWQHDSVSMQKLETPCSMACHNCNNMQVKLWNPRTVWQKWVPYFSLSSPFKCKSFKIESTSPNTDGTHDSHLKQCFITLRKMQHFDTAPCSITSFIKHLAAKWALSFNQIGYVCHKNLSFNLNWDLCEKYMLDQQGERGAAAKRRVSSRQTGHRTDAANSIISLLRSR